MYCESGWMIFHLAKTVLKRPVVREIEPEPSFRFYP